MQTRPVVENADADLSDWDDQDLLERYVRTEQPEYLTEIVQRYYPLVVSIVSRNLRQTQDIQDGVQATFLILVKSAAKIRRRKSLAAWLHGVAHRTASRLRERRQREYAMQCESYETDILTEGEESPLAVIAKKMQLDALDEELQLVREAYRAVLVDHYLLGHTAAQIAERCNLSQATVEGRLRRGRQQLRMRMLRRGFGFSAAVAFANQTLYAQQVFTTEMAPIVNGLHGCTTAEASDIPTTVSNLLAEETKMSQLISTKLWLTALVATTSTAVLGLLAITAVGEQTGQGEVRDIVATAPADRAPAATVVPRQDQVAAVAQGTPTAPAASDAQAWPAPPVSRVQLALRANVLDVSFNAMPLQQVLTRLGDDLMIAFWLDVSDLKTLGIDVDTPMTLELPSIPLYQTLDYLLSPLGLSYRVEGDILHVSSREKLDQRPSLRVYDLTAFETPNLGSVLAEHISKIPPQRWESRLWSINQLSEDKLLVSASDPVHFEIETMLAELARQFGKVLPQLPDAQPTSVKRPKATPPTAARNNPFSDGDNPFGSSQTKGHVNPFGSKDPFGSGN